MIQKKKNESQCLDSFLVNYNEKPMRQSSFEKWYQKAQMDPFNVPTFFIAEIGLNHGGDFERAEKLILSAKNIGADAVKFQIYQTGELVHPDVDFMAEAEGIFRKCELEFTEFQKLNKVAQDADIDFISTPFSPKAVHFLNGMNVPAFKVASGDINNFLMLSVISSCDKPIILSTGASTMDEVRDAIGFMARKKNRKIVLMHCLSEYPASLSRVGWYSIPSLFEEFKVPVGFSDHTQGIYGAVAAVSFGARIIEKHFTLSKADPGVDSFFSADEKEFREMVNIVREIEKGLGSFDKIPTSEEKEGNTVGRRGVYFSRGLSRGKRINEDDLVVLRPQNGFSPRDVYYIIGKTLKHDVGGLESVQGDDFE